MGPFWTQNVQSAATIIWRRAPSPGKTMSMPRHPTLLRSTPLVRFATAFGAVLSGCSGEAPHEAAETDGAAASQLAAGTDGVETLSSAAPDDVRTADLIPPEMNGGQSGG